MTSIQKHTFFMYSRKKNRVCILSVVLALAFFLAHVSMALAADNQDVEGLYTVDNILIDKKADNAVAARDLAIAEGQRHAYEILVKRLLVGETPAEIQNIEDLQVSSMINDYETRDEKFSSKRYRALLTVRFNPSSVKSFLSRQGKKPVIERRGNPVLVLPFLKQDKDIFLWSGENAWLENWQLAEQGSGLVPVVIPAPETGRNMKEMENLILAGDQQQISLLLDRYKTNKVILPIAEVTDNGVTVEIYEYVGSTLSLMKTLDVPAAGDVVTRLAAAIPAVRVYIGSDWKSRLKYSEEDISAQTVLFEVKFQSMSDWLRMRKILESQSQISDVQVTGLNRDHADIKAVLKGSPEAFQNELMEQNLIMRKLSDGYEYADGMPAHYEILETASSYEYPVYKAPAGRPSPVIIPPTERLPEQPSLNGSGNVGTGTVRGSYEYRYRPMTQNRNSDWDNTYEHP